MLELQGVCAGYNGQERLHQINAVFRRSCVSMLLGPNGCGKSTLLKTAGGLLSPMAGQVLLDGVPLPQLERRELARCVAYLPQNREVSRISVRRLVLHGRFPYLGYPRRYRPSDLEAAERAMEWVGISRLAERMLPELSGGERQKAYLAMALAQETDLILLDEPTTYLDVSYQLELMSLVRRLRDQGKAVVMVLHDLNQALRWGDQVTLLSQGQVVGAGTPEELYNSGRLQEIFQVKMGRFISSEAGNQYFFYM